MDLGSVLCCQDRAVIGPVSDTFGPVAAPFYVVCLPADTKLAVEVVRRGARLDLRYEAVVSVGAGVNRQHQ